MPAGKLRSRLHFQERAEGVDEFGNPVPGSGEFATVFTDAAEIVPRMGSEPIIAARLQGVQPVTIRARSNSNTRTLTAAFRAVDVRTGTIYAITSPPVNTDQKNDIIEMLATSGTQADA